MEDGGKGNVFLNKLVIWECVEIFLCEEKKRFVCLEHCQVSLFFSYNDRLYLQYLFALKKDKPITDVLIIYLIQPVDSYTYDKVSLGDPMVTHFEN